MKNKKTKFIVFLAIFFLCFSHAVSAASLEVRYPVIPGAPDINAMDPTKADLPSYVLYFFFVAVYLSGVITLVVLIIGALKYFTSVGDVAKMVDAKNQIASALIGLGIMLVSYSVLYNINPNLIILSFQPPEKIPEFKDLKMEDLPGKLQSSIYTEIPIGKIIERMFETKKIINTEESPTPTPAMLPIDEKNSAEENKIPRMQRLENVSLNILNLSEKLREADKNLKSLSEDCSCGKVGLTDGYFPIECSPTPTPAPASQSMNFKNVLPFKSLGQIESEENSQYCDLTNEKLRKILDNDQLNFEVSFESALPAPKPAAGSKEIPASPSCWKEAKRDFIKGTSSLQAGSFSTQKTGKAIASMTVPKKGYFSFSYKTSAREPSCVCGPLSSGFYANYLCHFPANYTGLEIKINGKLFDNGKTDKIESGPLFHSEEWKTIRVLTEANARFSFEFFSPAEDPCFYAELDNIGFIPLSTSPEPSVSPTATPSLGCNCDPCKDVRSQIIQAQKTITDTISNGTTIRQKSSRGYDEEIRTSLIEQQGKAEQEIRLLQNEIGKLDRMEDFMLECGLSNLVTLSDFLDVADQYSKNKWILDTANFWDYIKIKDDWATFFCPVSGTTWEGNDPLKIKVISELTQKETDTLKKEAVSSRQMGFEGLVDYKKLLDQTKKEIESLNKQLKDSEKAKPEDKLTDDQIKSINAKLENLDKRKKDLEGKIAESEQSLDEIEIEKKTLAIEMNVSSLLVLRTLMPATTANYAAIKKTLEEKYANDPEKLKQLESALEKVKKDSDKLSSVANPMSYLINKQLEEYDDMIAELDRTKLEILNGLKGGNTGNENVGIGSNIGSLFEGEISAGCSKEIPMGELLDRSRRVAYKLIERLHKLISLSEDLIKSTSDMEVLLSQCSSQRCKPACINPVISPAPNASPTPTPTPDLNPVPRYQCGTPANYAMCRYTERCLSTDKGPVCYPGYSYNASTCGMPQSQSFCGVGNNYCMKEKDSSSGSASCCNSLPCGNWGNQICCPNLGQFGEGIIGDSCILKNNNPDCCNSFSEKACGDPGNQICCPKNSLCGLGPNNQPFCCSTGLATNTATVCGEPGNQICCPQTSGDNKQQYCAGNSLAPKCVTDPNYQTRTDSAFKEVCAYYSSTGSIDFYKSLENQCIGVLSFTKYDQLFGATFREHNPFPGSPNPAYTYYCTDCCESPNKICGEIKDFYYDSAHRSVFAKNSMGLCCNQSQKCINPKNAPEYATKCCPSNSVVCGEANSQICCQSNQKCGYAASANSAPYCIDYCPEPPEQAYCDNFSQVIESKNIEWLDEYLSLHTPNTPFWIWSRYMTKGFYNQKAEYYEGGSALMASIKHDKLASKNAFAPGSSFLFGEFNVKGPGIIRFYYKTSSYYNPSLTPLTVKCFKNLSHNASNEPVRDDNSADCFPGEMTLDPSTEWKKVEIIVPGNEEFSNALNAAIIFSFTYPPNTPNDDCVFAVLDKIQYLPSGATECEGNPCPEKEIEEKLKEINEIIDGKTKEAENCNPTLPDGKTNPNYPCQAKLKEKEGIKDVVDGEYKPSNNKTEIEQIGIRAIISKIVPSIFKDLSLTRETMKTCFYDPGGSSVAQDCELVKTEVGPDGKLISNCCYKECYMQDCLASCYLKEDRKGYKSCLFSCLSEKQAEEDVNAQKTKSLSIEGIDACRHSLNFYCCTER